MTLRRAFPDGDWRGFRILIFGLCLVGLFVSASGISVRVFHDPTSIKYLVTVAGFTFVALLTTVRDPLKLLVGVAVIVAPIYAVVTFQGAQVSPIVAVDVVALLVALPRFGTVQSALRPLSIVFALMLLPGFAGSSSAGRWLVWLGATLATGWIVFIVANEEGGVRFVVSMFVLSALIQSALAIWEFKTKHQLYLYSAGGSNAASDESFYRYGNLVRAEGTLPDPIGLGQVLALYLPLLVAYAASMSRWTQTLPTLMLGGIVALALELSLSRMSLVGGVVGVLIVLVFLPGSRRLSVGLGVLAVGAAVAVLALALGGSELTQRLDSIFHARASTTRTAAEDIQRVQIWRAALRVSEAHLAAGVGFGNLTEYLPRYGVPVTAAANAQNEFLQFLAEGGILALVALIGVLLAALTDLFRAFRSDRLWVGGCLGALVGTVITWSTDVELRYVQVSATVAILLGVTAALAHRAAAPEASAPPT